MSVEQIGRMWWCEVKDPVNLASRRLGQLQESRLVTRLKIIAHPEIQLPKPAATWEPGLPSPHFGKLSYKLRKRWASAPIVTPIVMASKKAVRLFGGRVPHTPRAVETTHDLHHSSVYLNYLRNHPLQAATWIHEDLALRPLTSGEEVPDAWVRTHSGWKVVEFGGAYRPERLKEIHEFCHVHSFEYEIW